MGAKRDLLATLIRSTTPVRVGWGRYELETTWTPLGTALREAAQLEIAAA